MLAAATAITTSVAAGTAGIAISTSPVTDDSTFGAEIYGIEKNHTQLSD